MKKILILLLLMSVAFSAWAALPRVELLPMQDLRVGFGVSGDLGDNNTLLSWQRDGDFEAGLGATLWHWYQSQEEMMELTWRSGSTAVLFVDLNNFEMGNLVDEFSHWQWADAVVYPLAGSPLLGFGGSLLAEIDYAEGADTKLEMNIAPRVQFGRIYDASRHVKAYLAADLMDRPNADLRYVINQMAREGEHMRPLSWRTDMDYYRNIYRGFGGAVEPISVKYAFDTVVDTSGIGRGMSVSAYPNIYLGKTFDGSDLYGSIGLTLADFQLMGSVAPTIWYYSRTRLYNDSKDDLFENFLSRWADLETYHLFQDLGITWFPMPALRVDQDLQVSLRSPLDEEERYTELKTETQLTYRLSTLASAGLTLNVLSDTEDSVLFEIDNVNAAFSLNFRIL